MLALLLLAALTLACWIVIERQIAALPPLDEAALARRSTVVLDRNDRLLRAYTMPDGRWRLPLPESERAVDPRFVEMLIAYEDRRFRSHAGVDPLAVLRAAGQWLASGRIVSGASTLTMQVARLIEPRNERSLSAKWRQMLRALDIERRMTKDEILRLYLALAPFGGNLEGVRSASLAWFGREPARLSPAEAALLVALPQAPETRRPDRFPQAALAARDRVLARAARAGLVDAADLRLALAETAPASRRAFPLAAPHLADQAVTEAPATTRHRLTVDRTMQERMEALASERIAALGPGLSIAVIVIDHQMLELRASVGGPRFLDPERAGALDLTRALRSPGSALKPFIYALAFDEGLAHPQTLLEDRPARHGAYAPENFDLGHQGLVTARKALQLSLNVPAVDLLAHVGPQRLVTRLRAMGAEPVLPAGEVPGLAVALGGIGITPLDLAHLYATLARGGETTGLRWRQGETEGPARHFVGPVAAWYLGDVLRGAPPPPDAVGGRIAFKTGTSYGYRDAWAVGFDARHTIAIWIGRPDNGSVPGLIGRVSAAPVLFDAFARIGLEPDMTPAPRDALTGPNAALPPPLRQLRQDGLAQGSTTTAAMIAALRIHFPPADARLDLSATRATGSDEIMLRAQGGTPPFVWLIDGKPLAEPALRRRTPWRPGGGGFTEITVIDGAGETDRVRVRLD
jgi:penicillin-binding protein 1C